jgi:signal transduction histidine kinase/CheY-like chemotaxis protein
VVSHAFFGGPLPANLTALAIGLGAFNGLLGWVSSQGLLMVSVGSMASFDDAYKKLNEARDRHLELMEVQEDLRLANNELARLSNRLQVLEHVAEGARQATTEFVANVSHELRTPLNMIIGYADMISRSPKVYGGRLPSSLMTDITAILRNAQHLSTLVNDVLDLSQVEAGRMAINPNWASLPHIINESLSAVKGLFESKGLYLKSQVPADFPLVYFDETRIRQVIINILSNAGRFTEQGGVILTCQIVENKVEIHIADTGPGIPKEDQERVFEPFQQVDASIRRRYGGSGLGLTISKQFIAMHGGKMWLDSQPGGGTTFSFSLPLESPPPALGIASGTSRLRSIIPDDEIGYHLRTRRSKALPISTNERYVVVDREKTLLRLITRYLPGAEIEEMLDVPAAVAALNRSPAQALILNIPPTEDVGSLTHTKLPFGTPVFSCWLPGKPEAASHLGVVEYLIKPLTREKLMASINNLGVKVKTVLIVDDEEDELHLFARHLEADRNGYAILQVTNGQRALSMLRSRRPDVMLLDLMMPGMNGFQVLTEKQQDSSINDIPVIIVSSRDPAGDPIVSDTFAVTQSGGLSQRNLIACIQGVGEILAPSDNKGK